MDGSKRIGNKSEKVKNLSKGHVVASNSKQIKSIYYGEGANSQFDAKTSMDAYNEYKKTEQLGKLNTTPSKKPSSFNVTGTPQANQTGGVKSRNSHFTQNNITQNQQSANGVGKSSGARPKASQSANVSKIKSGQGGSGGQFHVVHHNGQDLNNILQNPAIQNILQQNSGSKQQIIIVQSGGQTSQAINNLLQSQQAQHHVAGGGSNPQQAISLSGLTMAQLNSILSAYGLENAQHSQIGSNTGKTNLLANASSLSQQTNMNSQIQSSAAPHQSQNMALNSMNAPQTMSSGTGLQAAPTSNIDIGLCLQQQIEQLQAQNQIMQQQILNNVGMGMNPQNTQKDQMLQLLNLQQNQQQNIAKMLDNIPKQSSQINQMNMMNNQQSKHQYQQQQINSLQKQIMQLRDSQRQQNQFYQQNHMNLMNIQQSQSQSEIQINQAIQQLQQQTWASAQQQAQLSESMNMNHHQSNNMTTSGYSSGAQPKTDNQSIPQTKNEDNMKIMPKSVLQSKQQTWGSQISPIIATMKQKKKKESQLAEEREKKQKKQFDSKGSIELQPNEGLAQIGKGAQRKKDKAAAMQDQANVSRHYQSATQRNKTSEQKVNNKDGYGSKVSKNQQSPMITNSRGSIKDNNELLDSSDKVIQKIRGAKKKQKNKEVAQTPTQKAPAQPISRNDAVQNAGENSKNAQQQSSNPKQKDEPTLQQQKAKQHKLIQNQVQSSQNANLLQLPPTGVLSPPGLSSKEKKRLRLEKERERQAELFEKNFKREDLYIWKMGLNIQKSFITRPTAIIVYQENRQVKLDITPTTVSDIYKPSVPSAVPQLIKSDQSTKPLLITPEQLHDFYNHSYVRKFKLLNKNLEVTEQPKALFEEDQYTINPKQHSIQERKIREVLNDQLKMKNEAKLPENLAKNPIVFPSNNIKDSTIFFNSKFESGNLREVEKVGEFEYNCYVNFDFNSTVYSQWFYFSVRNIAKGKQYKFNIMNLQKDESCFQIGMKPFVYSTKQNREDDTNEWGRAGDQVCYYKNKLYTRARECAPDYEFDEDNIPCYEYDNEQSRAVGLNTLSFCYEFKHENDITYFAYFQPYNLSDLEDYLFQIQRKYEPEHLSHIYKCEKLCDTVGKKPCYVLTITDNVQEDDIKIGAEQMEQNEEEKEAAINSGRNVSIGGGSSNQQTIRQKNETDTETEGGACLSGFQIAAKNGKDCDNKKQTIFLTARVHPGESNASFMIQGAIDFLLQKNNKEAKMLRETFIFKIVPMLNPDGVVNGNYRCDYIGADLNRRWPNPSKLLHPTIYYTKKLLKICHQDNQVLLFCDFHGHTRKRNVFMYGCEVQQSEINQHKNNNLIRIVPYLLDQKNKCFSFPDCKFANEREKSSTGRIVMFKEFGILNSYTIESTFYSCFNSRTQKKKVNVDIEDQIKIEDLYQVGNDFCETLTSIINSKILKRKFITDTTTPLGNFLPGQGGNPISNFFINQQNEIAAQKMHTNNSILYNQQNNVQSVLKQFINGPPINPYSLIGQSSIQQTNSTFMGCANVSAEKSFMNSTTDKKVKNKQKSQNDPSSMLQQFNSSRKPDHLIPDDIKFHKNAQNSQIQSSRKQQLGLGAGESSKSLYTIMNASKTPIEREEQIVLNSFHEQMDNTLKLKPKTSHNVLKIKLNKEKEEQVKSGSQSVINKKTYPNIDPVEGQEPTMAPSQTPQFHNFDQISQQQNSMAGSTNGKKHSYQLSSHRFKDFVAKTETGTGISDNTELIGEHLVQQRDSAVQGGGATTNQSLEGLGEQAATSRANPDVQIQNESNNEENKNNSSDEQNLMGPEQINILDQYINTKNVTIKQNGANMARNVKAGSFSQKLHSLDTSMTADQNQKSEVESPELKADKQEKKETYQRAQTFAYQNINNNLLEVPVIVQSVHNTPNHSINSGVIRLKQSDIQPGIINQSRLSAQYVASQGQKLENINNSLRKTAYQQATTNSNSFFSNNQLGKRQSQCSINTNKNTNQNFQSVGKDAKNDEAPNQLSKLGMNNQKQQSKSSLTMTNPNFKNNSNFKNIVVQNTHTPIKDQHKSKHKKYNQSLVSSAGMSIIKPQPGYFDQQLFLNQTQAQVQNFLPQQSNDSYEITMQLQNKYQAFQQRNKYQEQNQMNNRQSFASNGSQNAEAHLQNIAPINHTSFKRKYGVGLSAQQAQHSHVQSAGEDEMLNNYQNINVDYSPSKVGQSAGTGVLPSINLRPNSQSKAEATPQYPHRNIMLNMNQPPIVPTQYSNIGQAGAHQMGSQYTDQMTSTFIQHQNQRPKLNSRQQQPTSLRVNGNSTKNLSN